MILSITFWRLNDPLKQGEIRNLIKDKSLDILCIIKTRVMQQKTSIVLRKDRILWQLHTLQGEEFDLAGILYFWSSQSSVVPIKPSIDRLVTAMTSGASCYPLCTVTITMRTGEDCEVIYWPLDRVSPCPGLSLVLSMPLNIWMKLMLVLPTGLLGKMNSACS